MAQFKIRNSKGKLVNCITAVKFTPAAAKKKPKPKPGKLHPFPKNEVKQVVNSKGKLVNSIQAVRLATNTGPTAKQLQQLQNGIKAIIAAAETPADAALNRIAERLKAKLLRK